MKELEALNRLIRSKTKPYLWEAEDFVLSNPSVAMKNRVEDAIWAQFYQKIQRLKQEADLPSLDNCIRFAIAFYQNFILSLALAVEIEENSRNALTYKSLVWLGDLSRYKAAYEKDWTEAKGWYIKAIELSPIGGKPYAQLALISTFTGCVIDILYYNCLAFGNQNEFTVAKSNLGSFCKNESESTDGFEGFINQVVKLLINVDENSTNELLKLSQEPQKYSSADSSRSDLLLTKSVVILINFAHYYDIQFTNTGLLLNFSNTC